MARATITRMISLVPSRIWCTRLSRATFEADIREYTHSRRNCSASLATLKPTSVAKALGHGAMGGGVGAAVVQFPGGQTHHLPRRHQLSGHVGQLELQRLKLGQLAAKLLALVQIRLGALQRACAVPTEQVAILRPPSRPFIAMLKPRPSPNKWSSGTPTFVKK